MALTSGVRPETDITDIARHHMELIEQGIREADSNDMVDTAKW